MAMLSAKQVSIKYGFSDSQIRRMIREGHIKATKIGWYYVIDENDIADLERRRALSSKFLKKKRITRRK